MSNDMRDRIAEIIRNARMMANPLSQAGYAEADALIANGVILLPCQKGAVLMRNGERCEADHWNVVLTAFNEENHVRLFDVEEAERALAEREDAE